MCPLVFVTLTRKPLILQRFRYTEQTEENTLNMHEILTIFCLLIGTGRRNLERDLQHGQIWVSVLLFVSALFISQTHTIGVYHTKRTEMERFDNNCPKTDKKCSRSQFICFSDSRNSLGEVSGDICYSCL